MRRGWCEVLLDSQGDPFRDHFLAFAAGGDRSLEGVGEEEWLDHCPRHLARRREVAGRCRPKEQQVVIVGRLSGQAPIGGIAHRRTLGGVGDNPIVGDVPALSVHGHEDVALEQRGEFEVRRREGAAGVIGGDASGVVRASSCIHVDADQQVGICLVGADVPRGGVIMGALQSSSPEGWA